jgi:hypothetical protein
MRAIEENATRTCAELLGTTERAKELLDATVRRTTQCGFTQPMPYYSNEKIAAAIYERDVLIRSVVAMLNVEYAKLLSKNEQIVAEIRKSRLDEFSVLFVPTLGAELVDDAAMLVDNSNSECCSICTVNALTTSNTWKMRCCGAKMCAHCLLQHSFHTAAETTTAACIFCRAAYEVYGHKRD